MEYCLNHFQFCFAWHSKNSVGTHVCPVSEEDRSSNLCAGIHGLMTKTSLEENSTQPQTCWHWHQWTSRCSPPAMSFLLLSFAWKEFGQVLWSCTGLQQNCLVFWKQKSVWWFWCCVGRAWSWQQKWLLCFSWTQTGWGYFHWVLPASDASSGTKNHPNCCKQSYATLLSASQKFKHKKMGNTLPWAKHEKKIGWNKLKKHGTHTCPQNVT